MISIDGADANSDRRVAEARNLTIFVLTGGLAAACNVGSRILLSRVMRYELAVVVAYLVGFVVAFLLTRALVFEASNRPWHDELIKFASVNVASFVHVWLISVGFARVVFPYFNFRWHPESVAHLIGVCSPVLFSYYAHKHFTFRQRALPDELAND